MIDPARSFHAPRSGQTLQLRLLAALLVCLGPLLLLSGSRFLNAGPAANLIAESLVALVVIAIVAAVSLRNSETRLERATGWFRAGGAYLFVCALIVAVGVVGSRRPVVASGPPAAPPVVVSVPNDQAVEPDPVTAAATPAEAPPANPTSGVEQLQQLLVASQDRRAALQAKYRNLLSGSYFVRLLAPENLEDSEKVRQARVQLARLADSADGYAADVTAEGKLLVEQIQNGSLSAASKAKTVQAVQQVETARQADISRWIAAKRASIATSLGILTLVEQSNYAVVAQDGLIAFNDPAAGEHYEILVEQLRAQDGRARMALSALQSRERQTNEALGVAA